MKKRFITIGILSLVLVVMVIRVSSQEPVPVNKNYAAWAQEFLRAMYPSLNDKKYMLSLEGSALYDQPGAQDRWLSMSIGEGPKGQYVRWVGGYAGLTPPPKDFRPGPQYFKQFLSAGFTFDDHDHLVGFSASGTIIGNPEAEKQYYDFLAAHPDLTQAEINTALRKAGVKYGPGDQDAFASDLPVKVLERFLGKIEAVSVKRIQSTSSASGVIQWASWSAILQTAQSDGTKLRYDLFFDPFNGDLIGLLTVPQPGVPGAPK